MRKSKVSKTAAKVVLEAICDTLKECRTPEERAVISRLNSNLIKQWDKGNMRIDESMLITSCFDLEREQA